MYIWRLFTGHTASIWARKKIHVSGCEREFFFREITFHLDHKAHYLTFLLKIANPDLFLFIFVFST